MGKLDSSKSVSIRQSAAKSRIGKRSQTIPEGSTPLTGGNSGNQYIKIYTLKDPQTLEIRYVGKTKYSLQERLKKHLCSKDRSYRTNWIQSLLKRGDFPLIEELEACTNENWASKEKFWIKFYKDQGIKLTNLTEGGESGIISPQCRMAQLQKARGRKQTPEEIQKRIKSLCKSVLQFTKDGIFIAEYSSASEAARQVNGQGARISDVCLKRPKRLTHKGYIWRYKD